MGIFRSGIPTTQALLDQLSNALPGVRATAFDGCSSGPSNAIAHISITSPKALIRILRAPRGLGLARAWVTGEVDIEGDLDFLAQRENLLYEPRLIGTALTTGILMSLHLGYREFKTAGATSVEYTARRPGAHSIRRDLQEVNFHYSISPRFYRLLLGPSLTYSCGIFDAQTGSLEDAQDNKHRKIIDKLGLDASSYVLDIGCGWGSYLLTAAKNASCRGIGITASRAQYETCQERIGGIDGLEVRYGDYRELLPIRNVTAVTSIGMYEHVGEANSLNFFRLVRASLPLGGRYLNQSIMRREFGRRTFRRNSFAQRYIFPNGQLLPLSKQISDLEKARLRVISIENFGLSYASTIRHWLQNLDCNWDECVELEGRERVRAWKMYLAGSLRRFEDGLIDLTQVLTEAE